MAESNLERKMQKVAGMMLSKAKSMAKLDETYASGRFINSIKTEVFEDIISMYSDLDYAGAVIGGSTPAKRRYSKSQREDKYKRLGEWAKRKGMQPLMRDKKGRFKKVTDKSYRDLGFVLSRSIAEKGIIERYKYKGSNLFERVYDELREVIGNEVADGFVEDIEKEIKILLQIKE